MGSWRHRSQRSASLHSSKARFPKISIIVVVKMDDSFFICIYRVRFRRLASHLLSEIIVWQGGAFSKQKFEGLFGLLILRKYFRWNCYCFYESLVVSAVLTLLVRWSISKATILEYLSLVSAFLFRLSEHCTLSHALYSSNISPNIVPCETDLFADIYVAQFWLYFGNGSMNSVLDDSKPTFPGHSLFQTGSARVELKYTHSVTC